MVKPNRIGILFLAIIMMVSGSLLAQTDYVSAHRCGTHTPTPQETAQVEQEVSNWLAAGNFLADKAATTIPVAFHIVAEDDGYGDVPDQLIIDQVAVLNAAYNNINFDFSLAS